MARSKDKTFTIADLRKTYKGTDRPQSAALYDYLVYDIAGSGTFSQWVTERCEFSSEAEIEAFANAFAYAVIDDPYLSYDGKKDKRDVHAQFIFKRFNDIMSKFAQNEKWAKALAVQLWNSTFARRQLAANVERVTGGTPDHDVFDAVYQEIARVYSFNEYDMDKLWFFVMMVKAGEAFPNSLRRMLYLWGKTKRTGKTTTAKALVTLLNGETDMESYHKFDTTLTNEMQIGSFKVPVISRCRVAMMDECFYSDMGKTYADFKRFLTSSNGRARLPYGQEFEWLGSPNYVATSNEPLKTFIKDWQDRRYLSIEFKDVPELRSFAEIQDLWLRFVRNAYMPVNEETGETLTWFEWSFDLDAYSNETGERTIFANEFEVELKQVDFKIYANAAYNGAESKTSNNNRKTLKWFVDFFAQRDPTARNKRQEIEAAVVSVFGERNYANCWLLGDIIEKTNGFEN